MYETKSFKHDYTTINISLSKEGKVYRVTQRVYENLSILSWPFDDPEKARKFYDRLINDKIEKGYKEI